MTGGGTLTHTSYGGHRERGRTVGVANGSGTFAGVIDRHRQPGNACTMAPCRAIGLIKAGSGIQTLTGANTYTGATAVNGGTLQIGNGGAGASIGNTSVATIAGERHLGVQPRRRGDLPAPINGGGNLVKAGNGVLTLTGATSYSGTTYLNQGTLVISAPLPWSDRRLGKLQRIGECR